jgi:hypothetical protein
MTPSGIEPATFLLLSQCLNQLRQCITPKLNEYVNLYTRSKLTGNDKQEWTDKVIYP